MFDTLQITFWAITYMLILMAGSKSHSTRQVSIPYPAFVLNFAWEACSVFTSYAHGGHILCLTLDFVIVCYGFILLSSLKKKLLYILCIISAIIAFGIIFSLQRGMLLSSFAIDLSMAVFYIIYVKKMSPVLKISIATTKLLGDAFAGLYYAQQSTFIAVTAVLVFVCNLFYLCYCLEEKNPHQKKEENHH